ncbi:SPOC domain-containing protein 1 [Pseudonaja textilis]|uniref:SPOC domain-containing protein 1 n=1 Tax=Pseudonaja textilis TaxID=8673 RepID=UPI000EA8D96B|nr:SPOC domain-containing protein 1 [Pseudonaja textilis]
MLEKDKKGTTERGTTEVDNSTEGGGFSEELDPEQTNSDCDLRKSRNGAKSSKCSALNDQSLFATLSFIEPNHRNAVMDLCHTQTDEDRERSFDAEKSSTQCLEPSKKCMESGSHVVKEIEEDGTYYKTKVDQDVEIVLSRDSSETTISDVTQPYSLHSISVSGEGILRNKEMISAFSKDIFSKTSVSTTILSDKNPHKGGRCQVSELLSSFSEINLNLDIQTLTSNKSEIKLPIKEMVSLSLNTFTEKIHGDQMTLEKEESNTKDCGKNIESFWSLLKNNEIQCDKAPVCVADEKMALDLEYGDDGLSGRGAECLLSDGHLAEQTYPDDDDGVFIHTEVEKAAMPVEDKQEEEGFLRCQSQSVKMVFYELFGSLVKLLGSPSVNQKKSRLGRLTELEDSSNAEFKALVFRLQGPPAVFMQLINEVLHEHLYKGVLVYFDDILIYTETKAEHIKLVWEVLKKLRAAKLFAKLSKCKFHQTKINYLEYRIYHQGVEMDSENVRLVLEWENPSLCPIILKGCRTKEKTTPKRTPKPISRSWLSQEQSRIKVMEALTETLQKRLNESPDLDVQKNTASKIAKKVETEIFKQFGRVDRLYKTKYRSLLFNLKSTDNQVLFHKLMLGKVTPRRLVQMDYLEMASKELAEWRAKKNKHELEIIEKEEREVPRRCSEKFTHKGIIEIYREADIDVASEEIIESLLLEVPSLVGSNQIRELAADSDRVFEPATYKFTFQQQENPSQILHQNITNSEIDKRPQDKGRSAFASSANRPKAKQSSYSVIWNGLIQTFSVKQFVAKAYPVSGFGPRLCQALPTILQSEGFILPKDVWAYIDSIWPTKREEMGVIRFSPSLSRDFSSYHTLYTYLNNKQRYGIVESSQMEIFLVPLPAYQLVPSQFHPVGGPGLDRCHPALLLGLILPKRTHLDVLKTSHDLPPKAKRKRVTAKVSPENSCFTVPSHLQVDVGQGQSPQPPCTEGLSSGEGLSSLQARQEELTVDSLLSLIEQLKRDILCRAPSSSCHQDARDEVNQTSLGDTVHSTANSASTGEQLGNLTPEILGTRPCQSEEERQFCIALHPSDFCSVLGPLLSSGVLHPDQHETHMALPHGAQINTFESLLSPGVPYAEAVTPFEECQGQLSAQIPDANTIGEHNPSVEETLCLLQYVTQMQSNIQNLEAQPFSLLKQEMISALSQIPAGIESPPVQQDGGYYIGSI